MIKPAARVRRLVLDISPLTAAYLIFQAVLGLFLDFAWLSHPSADPMLMPGLLVAINGSMIAPKIPLWRSLPLNARDIDRARWWHSVGMPALLLALLLALPLGLMAMGRGPAPWMTVSATDIVLTWGGQFALCVAMAVVWMAMPLARRRWGRWSGLLAFPLFLLLLRTTMAGHGELRQAVAIAIPAAIAVAAALYLAAGHWPAPQTTAMWAAPSGEGAAKPSVLPGWPALLRANLPIWLWLWGGMAAICLTLKYVLPRFDLGLSGWILGVVSAQFAVTNLATAMRAFRALPLGGARLTLILAALLLAAQGILLLLFRLILAIADNPAPPAASFAAPLIFPLLYFPPVLRYGLRVAQFGYALAIIAIAPLQLMARDTATAPLALAGLGAIAALAVLWSWHEIARGSRAYRVQPLVPARWRGEG